MSSTTKKKTPKKFRHAESDEWFVPSLVTERQEIETPWGLAWAEVGTFLLTADDGSQMIITQDGLDAMTADPMPSPPPAAPGVEEEHPWIDRPILPGDADFHKDDRGPEGPPS